MSALFKFIISNPIKLFFFTLVLVLGALPGIKNFDLDASSDSLVLENDPDLKTYRESGNIFNDSDFLIVTIQTFEPIFSVPVIERIKALQDEITSIKGIESVLSIIDAPILEQPKVPLTEINNNFKYIDDPEIDLELAKNEIISNPIYNQLIISNDASTTAFQILLERNNTYDDLVQKRYELYTSDGKIIDKVKFELVNESIKKISQDIQKNEKELIAKIREVLVNNSDFADLYLGGPAMIANDMISFIQSDLKSFGIAAFLMFALTLLVFFQSWQIAFLILLNCLLVLCVTSGIMGYFNWKISVVSSNFIALLLILTISISVHIIERYIEVINKNKEKTEAIQTSLMQMAFPCFLAVATTIAAFISLTLSDIKPVIEFGKMMAAGISIAYLFSFIFLPIGMQILLPSQSNQLHFVQNFLKKLTELVVNHSNKITFLFLIFFSVMFSGLFYLKVENKFIDYFKPSTEIFQGMTTLDEKLGGTATLDVILFQPELELGDYSDIEDDFFDDDLFFDEGSSSSGYWWNSFTLNKVESIHDYLESNQEIGKVLSVASGIKLARKINDNKDLNELELALLRSVLPDDIKETILNSYINEDDSIVRISTRIFESSSTINRNDLIKNLNQDLQTKFDLPMHSFQITGLAVLYNNMLQSLFSSLYKSLIIVFFVIGLMFIFLFRSIKLAFIGLIPNLFVAVSVLGLLGLFKIPLDIMTITVASISVGMAVDNTIHYMYKFRENFKICKDYKEANDLANKTIGKAIFYTAFTISIGFLIFSVSNFIPTILFGIFTAIALQCAFFCSILLLPIMMEKMRAFN